MEQGGLSLQGTHARHRQLAHPKGLCPVPSPWTQLEASACTRAEVPCDSTLPTQGLGIHLPTPLPSNIACLPEGSGTPTLVNRLTSPCLAHILYTSPMLTPVHTCAPCPSAHILPTHTCMHPMYTALQKKFLLQ